MGDDASARGRAATRWLTILLVAVVLPFLASRYGEDSIFGRMQSTIERYGTEGTGHANATSTQAAPTARELTDQTLSDNADGVDTRWSAKKAPDYYRVVGKASIDYDVDPEEYAYSGYDGLGRTGRAIARVTYHEIELSRGWRAGFSSDVGGISGWEHDGRSNNAKVGGKTELPAIKSTHGGSGYSGYFYNRSHLIGDQLGGYTHVYGEDGLIDVSKSKSHRYNLIAGTRMQNVGTNGGEDGRGGMGYAEVLVADYLDEHRDASVWYSATPIYHGRELLPRAVLVCAVSDDGGLNQEVVVYNAAAGYRVDYATGEFSPTR